MASSMMQLPDQVVAVYVDCRIDHEPVQVKVKRSFPIHFTFLPCCSFCLLAWRALADKAIGIVAS